MSAQRCWACGSANKPPIATDGTPSPLFKCGWCGALNSRTDGAEATADPAAPRLMLEHPRRCRRAVVPYAAGCVLVAMMLAVIGSVFVLGLSLVLPALVGPTQTLWLHAPLAALLVFNIFYNYAACSVREPGPVQPHLLRTAVDASGRVRRGALDGCRFCEFCCFYKPAGAHHCRSCGTCVAAADHHCWYVNNCVGGGNLRNFILLLAFIVAGVGYGLAAGLALGWADRLALWRHTWAVVAGTGRFHPLLRVLCFSMYWMMSAPNWMALWAYFTGVCWAALMTVGMLLRRQVQLLLRGQTYLETLGPGQRRGVAAAKAYWDRLAPVAEALPPPLAADASAHPAGEENGPCAPVAATESAGMRNARRVFGPGHPLTWLLPAWAAAPAPAPRQKAS